jgi:hypothetical protein
VDHKSCIRDKATGEAAWKVRPQVKYSTSPQNQNQQTTNTKHKKQPEANWRLWVCLLSTSRQDASTNAVGSERTPAEKLAISATGPWIISLAQQTRPRGRRRGRSVLRRSTQLHHKIKSNKQKTKNTKNNLKPNRDDGCVSSQHQDRMPVLTLWAVKEHWLRSWPYRQPVRGSPVLHKRQGHGGGGVEGPSSGEVLNFTTKSKATNNKHKTQKTT